MWPFLRMYFLCFLCLYVGVSRAVPGIRGTDTGLQLEGSNVTVLGSLNVGVQVSSARPTDALYSGADSLSYYGIGELGSVTTQGQEGIHITSNGYRSGYPWPSAVWKSHNYGGNTGAAQVALYPSGRIDLNVNSVKTTGSYPLPTTRMTVDSAGAAVQGDLSVSGNLLLGGSVAVSGTVTLTNPTGLSCDSTAKGSTIYDGLQFKICNGEKWMYAAPIKISMRNVDFTKTGQKLVLEHTSLVPLGGYIRTHISVMNSTSGQLICHFDPFTARAFTSNVGSIYHIHSSTLCGHDHPAGRATFGVYLAGQSRVWVRTWSERPSGLFDIIGYVEVFE